MSALLVQISVCMSRLIAINCGNGEEKESESPESTPWYYGVCKEIERTDTTRTIPLGSEKFTFKIVRFELLHEWDYYHGLKHIDGQMISVPMYLIDQRSVGREGWITPNPDLPDYRSFVETGQGYKRAYPDPQLWWQDLDGSNFDATVSSVANVEGRRTKVELLVFSGGKTSKNYLYTRGKEPHGSV